MSLSKYKSSSPGAVYHLFNRGNHKQVIFESSDDYRLYRALVSKYCRAVNFSIISYCFMPNHIHLLVRQNGESSPAQLISRLHTSYAMFFNKKYGKVGHLFQDRYKQKIVGDDSYLPTLVSYIHLNPVKDGLIDQPGRYKWSSYNEYYYSGTSGGICDRKAIQDLGLTTLPSDTKLRQLAGEIDPTDTFESQN